MNRPLQPARCQLRLSIVSARQSGRFLHLLRHVGRCAYLPTYCRPRRLHPGRFTAGRERATGDRERTSAPTRISFRRRYIRYPRGVVRARPAAFPANLKDVRHLDGSHAPSLGAVKVDLKGCTFVAGTRRKCNHIVSTPHAGVSSLPLVTVATSGEIFSRRAAWEMP